MPLIYTNKQISEFIDEIKIFPTDWEHSIHIADYLKLKGKWVMTSECL